VVGVEVELLLPVSKAKKPLEKPATTAISIIAITETTIPIFRFKCGFFGVVIYPNSLPRPF
jgi:hypothetical protein